MGNVVCLKAERVEREAEVRFAELLEKEVSTEGSVQPLPASLVTRMRALREKAEVNQREHNLIEC